jgi:membrane-associated phospholipid phosphatase
MQSELKKDPLPPEGPLNHRWAARRRPALLVGLLIGLLGFLIWLPSVLRATLLAALLAQRALMSMLFIFALIVLSLLWSAGQRLDTWVFLRVNLRGTHPKWLDGVMWGCTQIGNGVTAFVAAVLFLALNLHSLGIEIMLGTVTLWILVEIIKALSDRARPFLALVGTRIVGWRERGRSFPSGHTAQAFFLMTLLSHRFQLGIPVTVALYAIAVLVGFTRMYLGAHYPRDVVAGAVLGSVWGVLAVLVDPYWHWLQF